MANKNIYTVGGTVQENQGVYITRKADAELLELCRNGEYAYVLCPRQVGKTSLMVRTANELKKEKILTVIIDLSHTDTKAKQEKWYLNILQDINDALNLKTNFVNWWKENSFLGETKRFVHFIRDVVLNETTEQLVIFFDEIDTTLRVRFTDDFFAAIRSMYNARATTDKFRRISFVFIGTATPTDFIKDPKRTPFNIGRRVDLSDFTFDEALPLASGLAKSKQHAHEILRWVFEWSNGHPYLTQKICSMLSQPQNTSTLITRDVVATTVKEAFFGVQDFNLQFVRDMLLKRAKDSRGVMKLYQQVLSEKDIPDSEQSINKSHLKLSGVVRVRNGFFRVSNKIYEEVFNLDWVNRNMPQPKVVVFLATQVAFILLLLLGYFVFFQQPIYILFAIWFLVSVLWTTKLRDTFSRIRILASKPIIFYKDPEPNIVPFYPREFLEDSSTDFRNALTFPLNNIIHTLIKRLGDLSKVVNAKALPSRFVGYLFFIASFLVLILVNVTFVLDTLSGMSLLIYNDTQKSFLSFNNIAFLGIILAFVVGAIVVFETRSSGSQLSAWSDRDQPTRSLAFKIALFLIPCSIIASAGWLLFNLVGVGRINLSSNILLSLIDWIYYALIPIATAIATFMAFSDAMRGIVVVLIVLGWLIVGLLYLFDRITTALGVVGPFIIDALYRLLYIFIDIMQWFITTPIQAILFFFILIQKRFLISPDDELVSRTGKRN